MFPTLTATLRFADLAYNPPTWTNDPQAARVVLDYFHALLETVITQKGGVRFKTTLPVMDAGGDAEGNGRGERATQGVPRTSYRGGL